MELLITILHVTTCLVLILTVLLQSGKGGGMGAALGGGGGGAGSQIFGGRGASTFLTRITSGAAIIFFLTSITLAGLGSRKESTGERLLREKQEQGGSLSGEGDGGSTDTAEDAPIEGEAADDTSSSAPANDEAPVEAREPADAASETEAAPVDEPATDGAEEPSSDDAP